MLLTPPNVLSVYLQVKDAGRAFEWIGSAEFGGGELLEKMKSEVDLTTLAKASKDFEISVGVLRKAFKEGGVKPDMVKAGCSYYSKTTVNGIVKKLKKA